VTRPSETFCTAAVTARRLGLTVRALRLYERHGLVRPARTAAGWRVYGPDEIVRLHQVIALKRLGLSLARIAALTQGGTGDFAQLLALQETELAERKRRIDRALFLVRRARARMAQGKPLHISEIVDLIKETSMSEPELTPEFQALLEKHYDPARLKAVHPAWGEADAACFTARKAQLAAETERLKHADPGSPEARDLVMRWRALMDDLTKGDAGLTASVNAIYQEGFARPELATHMPFSLEAKQFLEAAGRRLAEASQR
jgi:DNA-binding transcriptional MerR regulator